MLSCGASRRKYSHFALLAERVVHQFLEDRKDAAALGLGLLHQDVKHVELRIDAEISAAAAVPFQFADRSGRRRFRIPGIGADGQTITITKAIAGKVEVI